MDNRKKRFTIIKFSILLFIIIGVPLILYFNYRDTLFNKEWLNNLPQFIMQYKGHAAAVLSGLQILQVIISIIPGQPIQLTASYLFGVFRGYLLSIIGAIIGSIIAFHLAKVLGKDMLEVIFDEEKVRDYQRKLNSGRGLTAVLLIYLIPGLPKDLLGYVAGISSMRLRPFLLVSTIGRTPPMLGSLFFGYFISRHNYTALVILAVITAIILIICFIYRKKIISMLDVLEKEDAKLSEKHRIRV